VQVEGNYKVMLISAGSILLVLLGAVSASNFIVTTGRELPKPGSDEPELPAEPTEGREKDAAVRFDSGLGVLSDNPFLSCCDCSGLR